MALPNKSALVSGKAAAIVCWRKSDNKESYQSHINPEEWETVLPDFVFRKTHNGEANFHRCYGDAGHRRGTALGNDLNNATSGSD